MFRVAGLIPGYTLAVFAVISVWILAAMVVAVRQGDHWADKETVMSDKSCWESIKGDAHGLVDKLKSLLHEGNVRRVIVQHEGRTVAEFPLTAGVVGALLAPVLAAIGAIVAVLKDCTIQVERSEEPAAKNDEQRRAAG